MLWKSPTVCKYTQLPECLQDETLFTHYIHKYEGQQGPLQSELTSCIKQAIKFQM